jgi:hypothetical protein
LIKQAFLNSNHLIYSIKMRVLRAILVGILLWVLIFVEISIVKIGLGIDELIGNIIHYVLLIPMGIGCAWVYYQSKDEANGFILGLFMLLIGIILDLLITIPIFQKSDYLGFYSDPFLWGGFLIAVLTIGIYDLARKRD